MQIRLDRDSPLGHQGHLQEMPTGREIYLYKCILPKIGLEIGNFGKKTETQEYSSYLRTFQHSSHETLLWTISFKLFNCAWGNDKLLVKITIHTSKKLKLKIHYPVNSFGLFAETWYNF